LSTPFPYHSSGPFLEREENLAALGRHFQIASCGVGQFVTIAAEAGLGKSRLVDEFRNTLPSGVQFMWGRAFAATRTNSYSVWVDAFDVYLRSLEPGLCGSLLGDSPDLRRLFVAATLHSADARLTASQEDLRTNLFNHMAAMLVRMAQLGPVVLVLDNLHWADTSSIKMLHALIRSLRDTRVLMLMLYRHDDPIAPPLLQECLESLEAIGQIGRVTLRPFSAKATKAFVRAEIDQEWDDDCMDSLHALTQGNPLYIREYITYAQSRNGGNPLTPCAMRTIVPHTVEALMRERIKCLNDDARRTLAVAAVIEARIPYSLVRDVLCLSEEQTLGAFDLLTRLHLLRESVVGAELTYEFHKPLVQASVYQSLGEARRRYLHKLVSIELREQEGFKVDAGQLARHLLASGDGTLRRLALPYLIEAAQEAVAVFGNTEAVSLLTLALEVMAHHEHLPVSEVDLLLNLGESHKRLGQFSEAVSAWSKALALENVSPEDRANLRRCIARAQWQSGDPASAMETLKVGLEEGDGVAGRFGLGLSQEFALAHVRRGRLAEAMQMCDRLTKQLKEVDEPEILARVLIVRGMIEGYAGRVSEAQSILDRAITMSSQLHYPGATYLACYTAASLMRYGGDAARFERLCELCDANADRMHAVALVSWPDSIRVEFYTVRGRLRDAVNAGTRALKLDIKIDQGCSLPRTHAFLAVVQQMLGERHAALGHLDEAETWLGRGNYVEPRTAFTLGTCKARVAFLDHSYQIALEAIEHAETLLQPTDLMRFYLLHPYALPMAAEAAARMERYKDARRICDRIRVISHKDSMSAQAAVALTEGLIARGQGDYLRAHENIHSAIRIWRESGQIFDSCRASIDLASVFAQLGQRDKAVALLRDTAKALHEMGAVREEYIVASTLRKLGVRSARINQTGAIDQPLSRRELEVVALLRHGMTNKEVATKLFLSELTIETHVKNILRKLAVKSRAQIAAYAVKHRIGDDVSDEAQTV
jgi:DNA-binding CsgD family transcriptional regulator/tetratricopeptide (TPR) repeat protein